MSSDLRGTRRFVLDSCVLGVSRNGVSVDEMELEALANESIELALVFRTGHAVPRSLIRRTILVLDGCEAWIIVDGVAAHIGEAIVVMYQLAERVLEGGRGYSVSSLLLRSSSSRDGMVCAGAV